LNYLDLKMGNNENTKKQGKREKTATPNNGKNQATEAAGNY